MIFLGQDTHGQPCPLGSLTGKADKTAASVRVSVQAYINESCRITGAGIGAVPRIIEGHRGFDLLGESLKGIAYAATSKGPPTTTFTCGPMAPGALLCVKLSPPIRIALLRHTIRA
jgi:hypothetical protein